MHINLESILGWLIHYKYALIFPLAILEGPIVTFLTGFLASVGVLNFWAGYGVVVIGDLIGDCGFYAIGRFGRTGLIYRYGKYIGLHAEKLNYVEHLIRKNANKILIFGKFAHGTGSILWVGTGVSHIPFRKFLIANFFTTCIKSMILAGLGFYYGQAYQTFDTYSRYISVAFLVALVTAYFYLLRHKITTKLES